MRWRLIFIWLFCQLCLIPAALRFWWAIFTAVDEAWEILLAFDRLGNVATNGDWRETISARANRARREGRRWGCVLCRLLDWVQKDHCKDAGGI